MVFFVEGGVVCAVGVADVRAAGFDDWSQETANMTTNSINGGTVLGI
jgi:hypothetical protein